MFPLSVFLECKIKTEDELAASWISRVVYAWTNQHVAAAVDLWILSTVTGDTEKI